MNAMKKRPELLAPAGNFEKMKAAILYGADAVYLAGQAFGMRAAADNFSLEELTEAVAYAHARDVRVYVTVNTMPREYQYEALIAYFKELKKICPDALIIGDIGVLALAREMLPEIELHISTQASAVSSHDCLAWRALGAKRVVLSRELSMDEILAIRAAIPEDLELEAFIHGSMCVSYSGRCLLSNHIIGRDANCGMCAQPCRWNYSLYGEIREEKRPDLIIPLEEHNGETFIMASRDTCMIEHIPALMESGIDSFKIEGRMKSAYYTAVVTNTYKMAMDSYLSGKYEYDPAWLSELCSVSHREYATGYYFSNSFADANTAKDNGYLKEKAYLAVVLSYDEESGRAILSQRNKLESGSEVAYLTPGKVAVPFVISELKNEAGEEIPSAPHPYMTFSAKVPFAMKTGDIIRGM
jgi:putative protease